ncbi:hypothetical protein N7G274_003425 [Stereocaulon virgatum]|uniref:Uncharacterized protein n=1 Tax=Stereocaulon virgatum TaxID=373712 RepID=A0ABR4AFJ6_9LECA
MVPSGNEQLSEGDGGDVQDGAEDGDNGGEDGGEEEVDGAREGVGGDLCRSCGPPLITSGGSELSDQEFTAVLASPGL